MRLAILLMWALVLVGVLNGVNFNFQALWLQGMLDVSVFGFGFRILMYYLAWAVSVYYHIPLLLVMYFVVMGYGRARIVNVVLFFVWVPFYFFGYNFVFKSGVFVFTNIVELLLAVVVIVVLYLKSSSDWFESVKNISVGDVDRGNGLA